MIVKVDWRNREPAYQWAQDRLIHIEHAGIEANFDLWRIINKRDALMFILRWSK